MKNVAKWENKIVCVATSGGMDSTALLHYLQAERTKYGYALCAVHCEHGIRGKDSLADMRFVQETCKAWDIPLYVFQEDCLQRAKEEKTSVETAARNFRYACFERLLKEGKADYIATAHHQNDEAETVLFRIARGTSLSGAAAMSMPREGIIRPFLGWSKARIIEYVQTHHLAYREDKTNEDTAYTRNKLRKTVLPALEDAVSGAMENLARFAALAAEDDRYLYRQSAGLIQDIDGEKVVLFSGEKPLFTRACLTVMKGLGLEKDYTRVHLDSAYALQDSERGAYCVLPKNIVAKKTEKGIAFALYQDTPTPTLSQAKPFTKEGFDGGTYEVKVFFAPPKENGFVEKILRVDGDKIPTTAYFRFRKEGDTLVKFGGGRKSLKKYFNEEKIPVEIRGCLPLIAEKEGGEVYAVCGYEIADSVKVTAETRNTLYVALYKK